MKRAALPTAGWLGGRLWAAPVFAAVIATFWFVVGADFVLWDDTLLITSNPDIRGFTLHNVLRAFSTYDPELYIPLTYLSYQIEYSLVYLQPWLYHATNLLLHASNATLVALLLHAVSRNKPAALLGGLVFAVHPLQVEALAWASSRKDLLSTLFFLLSLLQFLRYREKGGRRAYYASLLLFLCSLLAKVVSVTLPVLLLLLDWLEGRAWTRRTLMEKAPFFALSVAFGVIALFGKRVTADIVTPWDLLLVAGKSTVFYLQKLALPFDLAIVYPLQGTATWDRWDLLLPWAAVLALAAAAAATVRRTRVIAFATAWYLLTLAPTFTNIAKGDEIYYASDRYAYIPLIGLLLLLGWALERAARRAPSLRGGLVGACALWVAALAYLGYWQARTWENSLTLLEHAARVSPHSMAAHINLSVAYRHVGRLDDAVEELKAAQALRDHYKIYVSLAAVELERKNYPESLRLLTKARAMPQSQVDPEIPYGMGLTLMRSGRLAEAAERYREALAVEPNHSAARNNLAAVELELGDFEAAKKQYEEAVRRDPGFSIGHYNIGLIEERQGRTDEAVAAFERAVRTATRPDPAALSHLGPLYAAQGRYDEAVAALRESFTLDPRTPSSLQAILGALQTVLAARPDHAGARALLQTMVDRGILRSR